MSGEPGDYQGVSAVETDGGGFVRPYARTGGRTRASVSLQLETIVSLRYPDLPSHLSAEHRAICRLCDRPLSVAEVAAHRSLPIGAARVVLSDMIENGLLTVSSTSAADAGGPDEDLMLRVLAGLRRL